MNTENDNFAPGLFYDEYAHVVARRIGYPTRAVYKSFIAWKEYKDIILNLCGDLNRVADLGGCYGFGLNAFLFHGERIIGHKIRGDLYELSEHYSKIGKLMFPNLNFITKDFNTVTVNIPYDIILMFDFLEHVSNPQQFLESAMLKSRFVIIKTPLETTNLREKNQAAGLEPPNKAGSEHPDGHLHFFTLPIFKQMLKETFDICKIWVWNENSPQIVEIINPETALYDVPKESLIKKILWIPLRMMKAYDPRPWFYRNQILKGDREGSAFILARSKKY